jgi:hypothetical protein
MKLGDRLRVPYWILLIEVLFFYRQVLFYDGWVIPWDLRYFHLPHASFIAECFRNGELPLWDPYVYCGRPFSANIQAQLFYPPLALAILISNWAGGANLLYFLEWEVVLHVFLAGLFTFWLLRRLGTSQPAALLGASVYQLGGFFASQTQHMGAVNAAAWMPLAWLSVLALRDGPRRRWLAALAFSLAMSVLSGLPAVTVAVFGSSLLLALALVLFKLAPGRLPILVALGALWALALAAIQFVPATQLSQLSVAQYRTDWLETGGGVPLAGLVSLVFPNFYGIFDLKRYTGPWQPTFLYVYCGLLGLLLAGIAAFFRRTRETTVFALLTLLCAFWMLGDSTPVGKNLYLLLPAFIRNALHPEFAMPTFTLGMAVLAGLGAQQFLRRRSLLYAAVFLTALDLILAGSGRPMNTGSLGEEPGVTRSSFEGSPVALRRMRLLVNQTFPPWRTDMLSASQNWTMAASLIEVPTANGYDPLALVRTMQARLAFCKGERWGSYYEIADPASPVLDLMNVRYVLSRTPVPDSVLERARLVHVADLPGHRVYENTRALPRFFLVNRIRKTAGMEEAVAALHSPDFDPRVEAIVEGPMDFPGAAAPAAGKVRVLEYRPNRVQLEVDSPAPAFLVTSETHYPGWRASLDGQPQPISYTNVAFRGLPVPAGKHQVLFQFAPAILWYAAALTAAAWLAILLCVLCVSFASLREPVAHPPPALLP